MKMVISTMTHAPHPPLKYSMMVNDDGASAMLGICAVVSF